jgi:hypothetical protein
MNTSQLLLLMLSILPLTMSIGLVATKVENRA